MRGKLSMCGFIYSAPGVRSLVEKKCRVGDPAAVYWKKPWMSWRNGTPAQACVRSMPLAGALPLADMYVPDEAGGPLGGIGQAT